MATTETPFLWGKLRFGAIQADPEVSGCVQLTLDGFSIKLHGDDQGLRHLTPYRVRDKKVLVLFLTLPSGNNKIVAVYVTNNERLVRQIKAIMVDSLPDKMLRLYEKRPRYIAIKRKEK